MANRVKVEIYHKEYCIVAEEEPSYIRRCAEMVAKEMERVMDGAPFSLEDGAVLAALNLADLYCKEQQAMERLRAQLRKAQEDNRRLKKEEKQQKQEEP